MTATSDSTPTLRAGCGKADITFRGQGVWDQMLDGQVKRHIPPEYLAMPVTISDPLDARALVLEQGGRSVVIVTMDVTAIGARTISQNILGDSADDFMPRLRARVEAELGIPGDCVNVSASHVHQVPRMLCDDEAQIERVLSAIRDAQQNLEPVTVGVGVGREDSLTCNRTMEMKDGTDYTIRAYHAPMPPDEQVERLRPVDPTIGVLRVDRLDGRPLAVLYHFASHLLLGAPDGTRGTITADHVGVARAFLESAIGGDVMAFFLQGAVGDVAEVCQFDTEHPGTSGEYGTRLGQSVLDAYRRIETGQVDTRIVSHHSELPLREDIPEQISALRRRQAALVESLRYTTLSFKAFLPLYLKHMMSPEHPSHWAYRYMHADARGDRGWRLLDERNRPAVDKYLQSIYAMEQLADLEERITTLEKHQEVIDTLDADAVPAEFQAIVVGDALFVTAPMEVLTQTALKLKADSPFEHTFVVSLANGYLHYAPPASYYPRGGYEATECLLSPKWEAVFDRSVAALMESCAPVASA